MNKAGSRLLIAVIAAAAAAGGAGLLVNIMERKQEARNPFYRVVELDDNTEDPATWGKNFPLQYDGYKRTVDQVRTRFGGSEAVPRTPSQADPRGLVTRLQKIFAKNAVTLLCCSIKRIRKDRS
jgi:nitrite reductase (cytochrome c-552)